MTEDDPRRSTRTQDVTAVAIPGEDLPGRRRSAPARARRTSGQTSVRRRPTTRSRCTTSPTSAACAYRYVGTLTRQHRAPAASSASTRTSARSGRARRTQASARAIEFAPISRRISRSRSCRTGTWSRYVYCGPTKTLDTMRGYHGVVELRFIGGRQPRPSQAALRRDRRHRQRRSGDAQVRRLHRRRSHRSRRSARFPSIPTKARTSTSSTRAATRTATSCPGSGLRRRHDEHRAVPRPRLTPTTARTT